MQHNLPSQQELANLAKLAVGTPLDTDSQWTSGLSIETLKYHGVSMLILDNSADALPQLSESLKGIRANMVASESFRKEALSGLLSAFNDANLHDFIVFKGSALAYSSYEKPWLRPRTDSDILIRPSMLEDYRKVFAELGFEPLFAIEGKYVSYQQTFVKQLSDKLFLNIDLHWKVNNRQVLAATTSFESLNARAQICTELGSDTRIPHPVDSVIIAALHRLGHHRREERLIWLYDIHILTAKFKDEDWDILTVICQERKLVNLTLDALNKCANLFDTKVPQRISHQFSEMAKFNEPSKLFLRRDLPEWRFFYNDLKHLKTLSSRIGFIRETLFPSADYLKERMQTNSVIKAFIRRAIRGAQRVIFKT